MEFDSNLVSGYLTAFKDFGAEVSKGKGELKIINMDVINLIMVMKDAIFIAGAADKQDDPMIIYHDLTVLLKHFLNEFRNTLRDWKGEITVFRSFEGELKSILKDGKQGEVKASLPILKIYKKQFIKELSLVSKKKMEIPRGELNKLKDEKKSINWTEGKKLPTQVLAQGFLSERSYKIAHLADGIHTVEEIKELSILQSDEVLKIIQTLEDLGLLDYVLVT